MIQGRKGLIFTLAIILLFSFSLVNCAKKPAEPGPMEQTAAPAPAPAPEPEPAPAPVQEYKPEPAPKPAPAPAAPPAPKPAAFDPADLYDVFFDFDKYDLSAEARDNLATNARVLKAAANVKIVIEGHCDERGTNEYNLALGERRANAVKNYLVSLGIPSARIKTISYGEEKPFAMGHNEEAWRQNRRGHFALQ